MENANGSHDTRGFWIDQIIAAAIFSVGLEILRDGISVLGLVFTGGGFGWLIFLRWEHRPMTPQVRLPNLAAIVALLLATAVVGYDIYDRHFSLSPSPSPPLTENWQAMKLQDIYHEVYRDETVELDGKRFVQCVFDNVTFVFKGTAPFEFNPWPPKVTGHFIIRALPDAPVVAKTLDLCTASEFNAGCPEMTLNQGPAR